MLHASLWLSILLSPSPSFSAACPEGFAHIHSPQDPPHAVVTNLIGTEFIPGELKSKMVVSSTGFNGPRSSSDLDAGWVRDYFPIRVGDSLVSYPSRNRDFLPFQGFKYVPIQPEKMGLPAGSVPFETTSAGLPYRWLQIKKTPLVMQGGAVAWVPKENGDSVLLVSELIFQKNQKQPLELVNETIGKNANAGRLNQMLRNLKEAGFKSRSRDEILTELATFSGVKKENILEMPWMPGERTGHQDMYVGTGIGKGVVAVPTIPNAMIDKLGIPQEALLAKSTSSFLDARAKQLSDAGLEVKRIPMYPPRNLVPNSFGSSDANFPTSVGWVRVGDTMYVPHYSQSANWQGVEIDSALRADTENALKELGLKTEFVDSEKLLTTDGSIHCITAEMP